MLLRNLDQARVVPAITVAILIAAAPGLPGLPDPGSPIAIVRSISVPGILAAGMALVVIGRGIALSMVAVMATSVAWYLRLPNAGWRW